MIWGVMQINPLERTVNNQQMLDTILRTTTEARIKTFLSSIGDNEDVRANEVFGSGKDLFAWVPLAGNTNNYGITGASADPARAIIEKYTNNIDAMIELELAKNNIKNPPYKTPREAATALFGRPTDDGSLESWLHKSEFNYATALIMHDDAEETAPTIDSLDSGIGIAAVDFPNTICTLNHSTKTNKLFLCGTYGMGSAAAMSFCKYTAIVSRRFDDPTVAGFTIIRPVAANNKHNMPCAAYLVRVDADTKAKSIMSASICGTKSLYQTPACNKGVVKEWKNGTLIRHFAYRLGNNYKSSQMGYPGCLYHAFHAYMIDPLLAMRLVDLRQRSKKKKKNFNQRMGGARPRLVKLKDTPEDGGRTECMHYECFKVADGQGGEPYIPVEVFVVKNMHRRKKHAPYTLRESSSMLYVEKGRPIVFTRGGQNQGSISRSALSKKFKMIGDHIVVLVDLSNMDGSLWRELLITTREAIKNTAISDAIIDNIVEYLSDSDQVQACEKKLHDLVYTAKDTVVTNQMKAEMLRMAKSFGLLGNFGYKVGGPGRKRENNGGEHKPYVPKPPLDTQPYPNVGCMAIISKDEFGLQIGGSKGVMIETDADSRFGVEGLIKFKVTGAAELRAAGTLGGGRMGWRIKAKDGAKVGDTVRVDVEVLSPGGHVLISDSVTGEVCDPPEGTTGGKGDLKGLPEVVPKAIDPVNDEALYKRLFPSLATDQAAFATEISDGKVDVYYSKKFAPLTMALERAKTAEARKFINDDYIRNIMVVGLADYISSKGKPLDIPTDMLMTIAKIRANDATAVVCAAAARSERV